MKANILRGGKFPSAPVVCLLDELTSISCELPTHPKWLSPRGRYRIGWIFSTYYLVIFREFHGYSDIISKDKYTKIISNTEEEILKIEY